MLNHYCCPKLKNFSALSVSALHEICEHAIKMSTRPAWAIEVETHLSVLPLNECATSPRESIEGNRAENGPRREAYSEPVVVFHRGFLF
jgi:hypothetical protein